MSDKKNILIMAGGTGGHIFPGLAVAKALLEQGWQVSWLGSKGGMEEKLVTHENIRLHLISVKGLRGNGILGWLLMPFSLTKAIYESVKIMKQCSPCLIMGFGGFVSGPGGLASFLIGKPLFIHEQNAIAGMTNKFLSKIAKQIFQAFPDTFKLNKKIKTVGNPVRKNILDLHQSVESLSNKKAKEVINILVIGGSRGAFSLNQQLPQVFSELLSNRKVMIHHQVGKNRLLETEKFYQDVNLEVDSFEINKSKPIETGLIESVKSIQLFDFIHDMAKALNWADIIIARAGASTVAEISVAGVASIFVPYPYAVDDHQTENADWLVKENAALSFSEKSIKEPIFLQTLINLVEFDKARQEIAVNASKVAYLKATQEIANSCENFFITRKSVRNAA